MAGGLFQFGIGSDRRPLPVGVDSRRRPGESELAASSRWAVWARTATANS